MKLKPAFTICILLIIMGSSSCALIFNKQFTTVKIHAKPYALVVNNKDTLTADSLGKTKIKLERQNKDVNIYIRNYKDSSFVQYHLKAKIDDLYYFNFLNYGFGYVIDLATKKKWGYKPFVYTYKDTSRGKMNEYFYLKPTLVKNEFRLEISFPYINLFMFDAIKPENSFGFLGYKMGLDYIYNKKRFVQLAAGAAMNFEFFVPVPLDRYRGPYANYKYNISSTAWLSMMHFHQIKNLNVGYGLSYGYNLSRVFIANASKDSTISATYQVSTAYNSWGLQTAIYYGFFKYLQAGIIYRPTFYVPQESNQFIYEHYISIDFGIKIPLNKVGSKIVKF